MKHLKPFSSFIKEGRFYNAELNPIFWQDGKFNPEVRTKLLQIAHDFYEDLKVSAPIVDIQLTGSLANYNWTAHSDLDVHVIMNLSEVNPDLELVKVAMEGLKTVWNQRHPVNIHGFDVELYAQDVNQLHLASGLYSLMKDEWLREPSFNPPTIDERDVDMKADHYIYEIEELMKEIQGAEPEEAKDIMERASVLKKKISKSRDEQLAHKGGEFSIENLVFKRLRNEGWIGKLIDLKAQAYSHIYSEPYDAVDSEFSTEADVIDENTVRPYAGNPILVLGPMVDGFKRLFVFYIDWVNEIERNGWRVHSARLRDPMIVMESNGRLVANSIRFSSPQNLKKYAGLADYHVVLNSKTKTPLWHQTVKFSNPNQMLQALESQIRAIPDVKFP
jgi:hypothetical protein